MITLLASELLLRLIFLDGGRTTSGGPGGHPFEYLYSDDHERRGPAASGPKAPGVQRILVMGDSITWGVGVKDWRATYPTRLLHLLNAGGAKFDMAVEAYPGKEIDNHVTTIARAVPATNPDIVVYQWYNNDVEVWRDRRPRNHRSWRDKVWHEPLLAHSYLYFSLDFALNLWLPSNGRSYLQYLEEDFRPDTPGWNHFAVLFHRWASYATGYADRTILMLYPPPATDTLGGLRRQMITLAAGQTLTFRPDALTHAVGDVHLVPDDAGASHSVLEVGADDPVGELAATPPRPLPHGDYAAEVHVMINSDDADEVGEVIVTDDGGKRALAAVALTGPHAGWETVRVPFHVAAPMTSDVQIHVRHIGHGTLAVDQIDLPVHYRIEPLDLAPQFGDTRTATSLFDAHPNEATHDAMAQALARQIRRDSAPH